MDRLRNLPCGLCRVDVGAAVNSQWEDDANDFDMRLYALITRAEDLAERIHPKGRASWNEVREILSSARPLVRGMMSEKDRRGTEG